MIKCETIGALDIAKINPVLTSNSDVANYSFTAIPSLAMTLIKMMLLFLLAST